MYVNDEDDFDLEEVETDESEESIKAEKKSKKKNPKDKNNKKKKLRKFIKITLIVVITFLASWYAAYSKTRAAHKKENFMVDELEKMYSEGDYSAMTDYFFTRVNESNDKKYAKYKRVAELYDDYQTADGYMRDAYSKVVQGDNPNLDYSWELEQLFRVIMLCDVYADEGYPYDEEKGVQDIRDKVVNYMQGVLLLDTIKIEKVADAYLEAKDNDAIKEVIRNIDVMAAESMNKVLE